MSSFKFQIYYKAPKRPEFRPITVKRIKKNFDVDRPWTFEFQMLNYQKKKCEAWVEPIKDWYMFKGDRVSLLMLQALNA